MDLLGLHLLHGGSSDFLNITSSGVADGNAVIIDLNPLTAADMRSCVGLDINHMGVFLGRRCLSGQIEVELSGFAQLRLGIADRCHDLPIDNESDLISANCQTVGDVVASCIGLSNLGKIFRFNPDIGAFDWAPGGVLHNPFNNRRASPSAERYKQ